MSGNDAAPNSAKQQLRKASGGGLSADQLNDWLDGIAFDAEAACQMPSFAAFYRRLQDVLRDLFS